MYNEYPYTDFHELNLDWFLAEFKQVHDHVDDLDATVTEFTQFVTNYFDNLDVQEEINNKLDALVADGTIADLLLPLTTEAVGDWLEEHITPTTPPVDDTLTIAGAAADAKVTGDKISNLKGDLTNSYGSEFHQIEGWISGEYIDFNDGSVQNNSTYHRTDYIEIDPNSFNLIIETSNAGGYGKQYNAWYDSDRNFIKSFSFVNDGIIEINPPKNAKYFRISSNATVNVKVTGAYINRNEILNNKLDLLFGSDFIVPTINSWIDGEYISKDDGSVQNNPSYHRTDYIEINPALGVISFIASNSGSYSVEYNAWYDENQQFISSFSTLANGTIKIQPPINARFMRLSFNKTTTNNISTDYYAFVWNNLESYIKSKFETHITHNGDGTYKANNKRNAIITPIMFQFGVFISIVSGYKFALQYFDGYETGTSHFISATSWITSGTQMYIPAGTYFCMIVANTDESDTDDTTQDSLVISGRSNINDIYDKLLPSFDDYIERTNKTIWGYCVNAGFMKTAIKLVHLNVLSGVQAFCIYDEKYYSTDEGKLYEQNNDFTLLSTTNLNIGHGNSLQLGSDNVAYVSGWNDNKVYAVNLTNKTIVNTINLPTSGYTTCAIDDINGIAYIFQRDSYPDTIAIYDFIVYDYINDNIINTKKITRSFGAAQACDFIDGKIFLLYGLGANSSVPNGYVVFNTNGDIISEYLLDTSIINMEPEGVFVDRNTYDIYLSYVNKSIYKLEQV